MHSSTLAAFNRLISFAGKKPPNQPPHGEKEKKETNVHTTNGETTMRLDSETDIQIV